MKALSFRLVLWLLLALPGALWLVRMADGTTLPMDLLRPTGELTVRLMILAMLAGPLSEAFGANRFFRTWLAARRWLGLASFGYALLHLATYATDIGLLSAMVEELELPGIWTGWLAFALMVPPTAISFDAAMRSLGSRWKQVQRLVYAAFIAGLAHWVLLDWQWQGAALHLAPLLLAWGLRWRRRVRRRSIRRSEVQGSLA